MSNGLFGGSKTTSELPAWQREAAEEMLQRSSDMGKTGYQPYAGPQVAALSPQQIASMENTASAANAFGMASPDVQERTVADVPEGEQAQRIARAYKNILGREPDAEGFNYWMENFNPSKFEQQFQNGIQNDPLTGLPEPRNFNGLSGYSSLPQFEQQMSWMGENRPGQQNYYDSFFVDPTTGAAGVNSGLQSGAGGGVATRPVEHMGPANDRADVFGGGGGHSGGGIFGGYSGVGDMFNGGGPGQSGDKYGGRFGGVSNAAGGIFGGLFG